MKMMKINKFKHLLLFIFISFLFVFAISYANYSKTSIFTHTQKSYNSNNIDEDYILKKLIVNKSAKNTFHYNNLEKDIEKVAYKKIDETLKNIKRLTFNKDNNSDDYHLNFSITNLDIKGTNEEKMKVVERACIAYLSDNKELFFLDGGFRYGYQAIAGKYTYSFSLNTIKRYAREVDLLYEDIIFFIKKTNELVNLVKNINTNAFGITKFNPTFLKVKFIHDWMIFHNNYNKKALTETQLFESKISHSPISALKDEYSPVCEGYAELANVLFNMLDIENIYVVGISGGDNHAWNYVKIDGRFYLLDITHDDPILVGETNPNKIKMNVSSKYFLTSTDANHRPDGGYNYPILASSNYVTTKNGGMNLTSYDEDIALDNYKKIFDGILNKNLYEIAIYKDGVLKYSSFDAIEQIPGRYVWYLISKLDRTFFSNVLSSGTFNIKAPEKVFNFENPKHITKPNFKASNGDILGFDKIADVSVSGADIEKTFREIVGDKLFPNINGYKFLYYVISDESDNEIYKLYEKDFDKPLDFDKISKLKKLKFTPIYDDIKLNLKYKDATLKTSQFVSELLKFNFNMLESGKIVKAFYLESDPSKFEYSEIYKNEFFKDENIIPVYDEVKITSNYFYQKDNILFRNKKNFSDNEIINTFNYKMKNASVYSVEVISKSDDLIKIKLKIRNNALNNKEDELLFDIKLVNLKVDIKDENNEEIPHDFHDKVPTFDDLKNYVFKYNLKPLHQIYSLENKNGSNTIKEGDTILIKYRIIRFLPNDNIELDENTFKSNKLINNLKLEDFKLDDGLLIKNFKILKKSDDNKTGIVRFYINSPNYNIPQEFDMIYKFAEKIDNNVPGSKFPIKKLLIYGVPSLVGVILLITIVSIIAGKDKRKRR